MITKNKTDDEFNESQDKLLFVSISFLRYTQRSTYSREAILVFITQLRSMTLWINYFCFRVVCGHA